MINYELAVKLAENEEDLNKMLSAHLGSPRRLPFYLMAFKTMMIRKGSSFTLLNGELLLCSLLLGAAPFYLFMKELKKQAFILLAVLLIPQIFFVFMGAIADDIENAIDLYTLWHLIALVITSVFVSLYAPYWYLQKFMSDAELSGYGNKDINEVVSDMADKGKNNLIAAFGYSLSIGLILFVFYMALFSYMEY